jgi:general secretion pathway protein L
MAQNELDRVLHFEIARHFPFPAERVHFAYRIAARGSMQGSGIEVELVAVPREIVAEICAELAHAGLRPSRIVVLGAAGTAPMALPATALGRRPSRLVAADRALLLTLAVLAAVAVVSPIVHHHMRLATVERETEALRPQVQSILDARDRERRASARTAGPLLLKASRPPLVAVLDALTRAVPDGSWLLSLNVSGREIVMDGLAPSAAATALALEESGAFTNVVFRSPITREPQSGLEHFQFSAVIAEPKP